MVCIEGCRCTSSLDNLWYPIVVLLLCFDQLGKEFESVGSSGSVELVEFQIVNLLVRVIQLSL